jgi:hypothetical protein
MPSSLGADMILTNNRGIIAQVEIKNRESLEPDVAAAIRRNIASHRGVPEGSLFLLFSQDKGYLWQENADAMKDVPPDLEFSMRDTIAALLDGAELKGRLRDRELELLIFDWLSSLAYDKTTPTTEAEKALSRVGVLEKLRESRITREVRESA